MSENRVNGNFKMSATQRSVLLISCPDRKGLIHETTGCLFRHGANIVENSEFANNELGTFHMRTEFTWDSDLDPAKLLAEVRSILPSNGPFQPSKVEIRSRKPKRLVLFGTREPHCLGDLLLRHSGGELHAEIIGVVSQYESLRSLTGKFGIPFHCIPAQGNSPALRMEHEMEIHRLVEALKPDLLVLAKYMRILSPEFVSHYENRILNIHHSFLPAFIGKSPYRQAYERGVKIIGATAHIVNEDLDDGPIITQDVLAVNQSHSAEDMAIAGRDVERTVLSRALKLLLEDRVLLEGKRTIIFD